MVAALGMSVMLSMDTPMMALIIPAAFILAVLLLGNSQRSLFISILALPLLGTVIMGTNVLPVPGAKVSNFILIIALVGFLINEKLEFSDVKPAVIFYAGSMVLLLVAALRSGHVAAHTMEFWNESYSPGKFFFSHGIIQALRSVPFIMIVASVRNRDEIYQLAKYLAVSMVLLSMTILGIFIVEVPPNTEFFIVRGIIAEYLGMHGNNLADFLIVGVPFLLTFSLDKKNPYRMWMYAAVVLALGATAVTYSRAAYFLIILSFIAVIFMTKKYKLIIPIIITGLMISFFMPSVVDRAMTGFDTGDPSVLSAGRTDMIWRSVIKDLKIEWQSAPERVIFGYGRYGVLDLRDFKNQKMIRTTQAHNMYLDIIINSGLLGLFFYLAFFFWIIGKLVIAFFSAKVREHEQNLYLVTGLLVSIGGFLIRGFTDSFFSPQLSNAFMYIVVAIAFAALSKNGPLVDDKTTDAPHDLSQMSSSKTVTTITQS